MIFLASYWYLVSILNPLRKIKVSIALLSNFVDSEIPITKGEGLINIALNLDNLKERIDTAANFSKENAK